MPQQFNETVLNRNSNVQYSIKPSSDTNYEAVEESKDKATSNHANRIEIMVLNLSNQMFQSSYNIPPTRTALIIYQVKNSDTTFKDRYVIESLTFGLVPSWAKPKDPTPIKSKGKLGLRYSRELQKYQGKHFNCRKESLANKTPVWNSAKKTRCVVPIQGYFEWLKSGKTKTPYFVYSSKSPLIYLAALYSHNTNYSNIDSHAKYLSSFTIITGPATKEDAKDLSWLHPRKPLMLMPGTNEWFEWLDPDKDWSDSLLDTCLNTVDNKAFMNIEYHTVSDDVGKPFAEGKYLVEKYSVPQKSISQFFKPATKRQLQENDENKQEKKPKTEENTDIAVHSDQGRVEIKREL